MKNIIFVTKEKNSLTLLIPCSLIPSMVRNGVFLSDSCKHRKHQNSHFGGIATNIVGIALKQKEKSVEIVQFLRIFGLSDKT